MPSITPFRLALLATAIGFGSLAQAQIAVDDSSAIIASTLNYVDGWYEGDADRMKLGLHPDLVKRSVYRHAQTERSIMRHISASTLVEYTRTGGGKESLVNHARNGAEVTILDVFENIATVRAVSVDFVDYLHLVKYDGTWLIINILWDR